MNHEYRRRYQCRQSWNVSNIPRNLSAVSRLLIPARSFPIMNEELSRKNHMKITRTALYALLNVLRAVSVHPATAVQHLLNQNEVVSGYVCFLSNWSLLRILHRYSVGKEFLAFSPVQVTSVTPLACLDVTALKSNVPILFFKKKPVPCLVF